VLFLTKVNGKTTRNKMMKLRCTQVRLYLTSQGIAKGVPAKKFLAFAC